MDEKEKEFYRRIKTYRVDPSASSMANPVPGTFNPLSIEYGIVLMKCRLLRRKNI